MWGPGGFIVDGVTYPNYNDPATSLCMERFGAIVRTKAEIYQRMVSWVFPHGLPSHNRGNGKQEVFS